MVNIINQALKKVINHALRSRGYQLALVKKCGPTGVDIECDFRILLPKPNPICLDVGANVGQTINEFNAWLTNPTIHSFEPSSTIFKKLQEQKEKKGAHWKNVSLYPYALGDQPKTLELTNYKNNLLSSLLELEDTPQNPFRGDRREIASKETVDIRTVDDFLVEKNIQTLDMLKIDTQGFDYNVLKGAAKSLAQGKISYIFLEMNFVPMYEEQGGATTLIDYLEQYDMKVIGFYDVYRPISRNHIAWCSTLFGKSTLSHTSQSSRN